jgi:hypothetical protein
MQRSDRRGCLPEAALLGWQWQNEGCIPLPSHTGMLSVRLWPDPRKSGQACLMSCTIATLSQPHLPMAITSLATKLPLASKTLPCSHPLIMSPPLQRALLHPTHAPCLQPPSTPPTDPVPPWGSGPQVQGHRPIRHSLLPLQSRPPPPPALPPPTHPRCPQ